MQWLVPRPIRAARPTRPTAMLAPKPPDATYTTLIRSHLLKASNNTDNDKWILQPRIRCCARIALRNFVYRHCKPVAHYMTLWKSTQNLILKKYTKAVLWLRRLVAGLLQRKPGFDPGSVIVGFVVDKVALGQVYPGVLRFFPVSFIPPVLHYTEIRRKLIIFITGLHSKPQGCGASVASAAGPLTKETSNNVIKSI
jgi:hypothetical protein